MLQFNKLYPFILVGAVLIPLLAFGAPSSGRVNNLIDQVRDTMNLVIQFLFVLATIIFLWGVVTYIAKADDDTARKKAKMLMLWGIIGLAVMAAVWGIVNIVLQYFVSGDVKPIPHEPGAIL